MEIFVFPGSGDHRTTLCVREINLAVRFSGELFHIASFASCLHTTTRPGGSHRVPDVDHHEQSACRTGAKGDETLFTENFRFLTGKR
jgi:hypothetical protein